jgi:hypothetical protein
MRSSFVFAFVLLALASSATAAAADSVCPTAPPGAPSLFLWHTTRQLDHVVWSSDGQQIGAVDYVFEEKLPWNPFAETTD